MNAEQAFGTLEAYLAGGDELGDVSHDEAADALNTLRLQRLKCPTVTMHILVAKVLTHSPQYLLILCCKSRSHTSSQPPCL